MRLMQAAGIDAFGGGVHLLELPVPETPGPDDVVISVRAAGVGNWNEIVRVGNGSDALVVPVHLCASAVTVANMDNRGLSLDASARGRPRFRGSRRAHSMRTFEDPRSAA